MRRGTLIALLVLALVLAAAAALQIFLLIEGEQRFPGGPTPRPTSPP